MIDVSIDICTYDNIQFLRLCLLSLYQKIRQVNFEIIVVDNASQDGTSEMIKRDFPDVVLIENVRNKGVAPARNQAITRSRGRYVLLLDSDTEFVSDNFADLIHYLDASPDVGLLGVKQITFDNQPYPSARTFPSLKHVMMRRLSFLPSVRESRTMKDHHLVDIDQDRPVEIDYTIGAFQLIRNELFPIVGLLDEKMFYGFEDADYCARIKKAGYKIVRYPFFTIKHYVQGLTRKRKSISLTGLKLLFHHFISYSRFYIKHHDIIVRKKQ